MKIFIVDGTAWRGVAHFSRSFGVVFISDKVEKHAHAELIERVTTGKNTIWR